MSERRGLRARLVVALVVAAAMAVAALLGPHGAGATPAPTPPDAGAAIDWLDAELTAGGHQLARGGATDWGVTADALLAAVAAGRGADPAVAATTDGLLAHLAAYTTWDDLGPGFDGVRLAGPTAKVLLVALLQQEPAATTAPIEAELRSLVQPSGAQAGRVSDRNPHGADTGNGFGQAEAILALARTAGGVPPAAVAFLLDQQCPDGAFRLAYPPAGGCTDPSAGDSDATALAVEALLGLPRTGAVAAALARATGWLLALADPVTGSFGGTGPTASPNANSTGLISQALRAAGQVGPADRGADWVRSLQLTAPDAGAASADIGAIAYDPAAFAAANAAGIGDTTRDQWHRATAQAVLALGLPAFGSIGSDPPLPVDLGPTTTSSAPPATTTSAPTTSTSTPPPTTSPTSTTTSSAAASTSTTPPSAPEPTTTTSRAVGTTSTTTTTGRADVLAATSARSAAADAADPLAGTGIDPTSALVAAAVLLAGGSSATLAARRRRSRRGP